MTEVTQPLDALRHLAALRADTDAQIDAAMLRAVDAGASVRQIAAALGVSSPATVTKRLHRIRAGQPPGHRTLRHDGERAGDRLTCRYLPGEDE